MMLDRTIAPSFKKPEVFKLPPVSASKLSNGVPYLEVLTGTQPAVKVELVFDGGHLFEPKTGVSFFTSRLLTSGTSKLSAAAIEETIASYGAHLELSSGYDHAYVTVYCLDKHLENVLLLVKELIKDAVYPQEELDNLKHIHIQNLKVNQEKVSYLASTSFRTHFFKDCHPYSRYIDIEAINNISREDLLDFHGKLFSFSSCSVFLSGGGKRSHSDVVNKVFGDFETNEKLLPLSSCAEFNAGRFHTEKEGALQTSIRVALPGLSLDSPEYYKLSFVNEILGGYFGSRLMKNIREDKGYTYGIHSSLIGLMRASYFICGTDVKKEVADETINEINKEISILKTERVDEDEMETVKNYMVGSFLNSINSPFSLMDKFKTLYFHNLPADYFYDLYNSIYSVTAEDVLETMSKYFTEENMITVTAG